MRCLRRILNIRWQDKISNITILERAGIPTLYTILKERRMRWVGHVVRMEDSRIPKSLLYGELTLGKRPTGRPHLRYKDVCKRDLKAMSIDEKTWEVAAQDRKIWKQTVSIGLSKFEEGVHERHEALRSKRKSAQQDQRPSSHHVCCLCQRDCHSKIGLFSHARRCTRPIQSATP